MKKELDSIKETIARKRGEIATGVLELSHRIHANPELGFEEFQASGWIADDLRQAGFDVEIGVANLPTALVATAGTGELVFGICAEYDALPEIGHACGHNVIAAAAVAAARFLQPVADELGITIKVFGTPAEESGGGKILMLNHGVFDGIHAAMMVHPLPWEVPSLDTLAVSNLKVEYTGKTAHASVAPEKGINAGDALTVAQVAIGLLRQHIHLSDRIHGIVTSGGEAPNVIPGHTSAHYYIRSRTLRDLAELQDRVVGCFEAGAIATGASLKITEVSPQYSEFNADTDMTTIYQRNAQSLGRSFEHQPSQPDSIAGSTDMANISLVIPTIHPTLAIECGDSVNHQPEFAAWCVKPSADKAVLDGGLAMALTVVELAMDMKQRARLLAKTLQREST